MASERKTGEERRAVRRYPVTIEIEWEGEIGRQKGTISDISTLGCFILCSGEVEDGESLSIFIPLADGMKVQFSAVVVNHVYEIGFGVKFSELSEAQNDVLRSYIESADG